MKKKELLDLIVIANKAEEEMVSNLAEQISSALEWFQGTKEELGTLRNGLKKLQKESKTHADLLEALRKKLEKDDKDVY